ncbi:hypothetical protein [Marinagarivorans algicola]|uniref:hypothetical protein n=1 Tax=Marinagarivorans algicola TaxID=1513270 RepID=UPI0006B9A98A|nr:hypothetical protein [Marinagarivorans algicola]
MSDDYDVLDSDTEADTVEGGASNAVPSSTLEADTGDQAERERARKQLEADVKAFLARGGKIQEVDVNVMADPPKAPQSNYGGQPI